MAVKARMRVIGREERNWSSSGKKGVDGVKVTLQPVYDSDPASPNHSFSRATPSGQVELTITNPAAFDQFIIGQTFDVDFTAID
jgi:hypothetical protein